MSDSIENIICDTINLITDKKIKSAGYDKTIQATILSCTNALTGEYKIKYQDNSSLVAYAANPNITYKKNTLVEIQVPNSDLAKKKIIIGAVDKSQEEYSLSVD